MNFGEVIILFFKQFLNLIDFFKKNINFACMLYLQTADNKIAR